MNYASAVVFVLMLASTPVASAVTPMEGMDMKPAGQTKQAPKSVATEVRKIYLDTGKVTLKHGVIDNLGIGTMTMTFAVKDRASLQHFKEGQAVWAVFNMIDGQPTVIDLRSKQTLGGARPIGRVSLHIAESARKSLHEGTLSWHQYRA